MSHQSQIPAVFLDRDGVLIENVSTYVRTWDEVEIYPYAKECLQRLKSLGIPVFVITNQSIVGRGILTNEHIETLHQSIIEALDPTHAILRSYICPHSPEDGCTCRKPLPGSLLAAADEYGLNLSQSFMVGDAVSDIEAGINAGATSILVLSGRGKSQAQLLNRENVPVVPSLVEAVDLIESKLLPNS